MALRNLPEMQHSKIPNEPTLCYSLLRTIVVAFGSLENLQPTRLSAAAEISFAGRIYYLYTIHIQK